MFRGLNLNTVRRRKGGAEELTHVAGFGCRMMLIREEFEALVQLRIVQADPLIGIVEKRFAW